MMIFDFIVLRNGLPLISVNLQPTGGICQDDQKFTLVSGFFQAITSFADSVDHLGQVDEVQMTDILFTFQRKIITNKEEMLFILSSDNSTEKMLRKIIIEESSSTFLHMFKVSLSKKWNGDVKPFKKFKSVFKDIVKKLQEFKIEEENREDSDTHSTPVIPIQLPPEQVYDSSKFISPEISQIQASTLGSKENSPNQVSERFSRYQMLQKFQNSLAESQSPYEQFINPKIETISNGINQYATNQNVEPISSGEQDFFSIPNSFDATPQMGIIQSSFQSQLEQYISKTPSKVSIIQTPQRNLSSFVKPKFPAEGLFTNENKVPSSNYYRPSVYDLIPAKLTITAGAFRNQNLDSNLRLLIVAIDGRKSINELAEQLNANPTEVLQACQILVKEKFVQFKRF